MSLRLAILRVPTYIRIHRTIEAQVCHGSVHLCGLALLTEQRPVMARLGLVSTPVFWEYLQG
jgi:hypothetical protein